MAPFLAPRYSPRWLQRVIHKAAQLAHVGRPMSPYHYTPIAEALSPPEREHKPDSLFTLWWPLGKDCAGNHLYRYGLGFALAKRCADQGQVPTRSAPHGN